MLKRQNLTICIRSTARLAPLFTPEGVRLSLGWNSRALRKHTEVKKKLRTVNQLNSLELNGLILRFGFLTLIKASQRQFPPKEGGKVTNAYGVTVQLTRYDDQSMQAIFGASCIPVVSTKDEIFIKRCFELAHITFSMDVEDRVSTVHRSISQTLQAAKVGVGGFSCKGMRQIFRAYISKCPRCIRQDLEGPGGSLSITLGTPRLASLLGRESPCFHTISVDLQGPYILTKHLGARKTRGQGGTYKVYSLFLVDLLTKCSSSEWMSHCTSVEVISALKSFSSKFRLPRVCIADAGSQLVSLEKNPIFNCLKTLGISVETVPARHQRLNFCERVYKDFKILMQSMRRDPSRSIYDQGESLIEVQRKVVLCSSVMNSSPILVKYSDQEETVVMKDSLLRPYLAGEALDERMSQVLGGISGAQDGLFADVLKYSKAVRENVQAKILSYLQDKAVAYDDQRKNGRQEAGAVTTLQIDDIVAYAGAAGRVHLGMVTGLVSKNVAKLRVMKFGKVEEISCHFHLLKLVYRPQDGKSFLNLMTTALKR